MNELLIWIGILACLSQAGMLSGLNLAMFRIGRLRLEAAAGQGDKNAAKILALRRDANFLLATILWANVAVNVGLTLLSDSVLAGFSAFIFSTVVLTLLGEIVPQAYFSRHALRIAARLAPILRIYRAIFWPLARPTGKMLDAWIGPEGIPWYYEHEIGSVLERHARDAGTEISEVEAIGAINFLALDDLPVGQEGEPLDPQSVIRLPFEAGRPVFPELARRADDPFLRRIAASGRKWVVLMDEADRPRLAVNAPALLQDALIGAGPFDPLHHCHRPLVVEDARRPLGDVLGRLTVQSERPGDDVIDEDLVLVWEGEVRRIITGADLLGRLLRGIARSAPRARG
ncbi:MAG: DUF21 domain-containing protein [Paracoccaceae bacterium]